MSKEELVDIEVDDELYTKMQKIAKNENITIDELATLAIKRFLEKTDANEKG